MSETVADLEAVQAELDHVQREIGKRIVGQESVVEAVLTCMLCDGNALIEGNPGLAKTLLVRTIAEVIDLDFSRIQNTPDLMPSDITGTEVLQESADSREFVFQPGPIFANIVLADEINRATPKTQAALLEAMEEHQVTAGGETHRLPDPFFVLATQNPIDQEGTYPLPEAQSDRFLLKILIDFPSFDEEIEIVDRYTRALDPSPDVERVMDRERLIEIQRMVREVPIANDIRDRAVEIVAETRSADAIDFGASPRASLALVLTAKARALLAGRAHVSEADLEAMAKPVLRHRIILDFTAERDGLHPDDVNEQLL